MDTVFYDEKFPFFEGGTRTDDPGDQRKKEKKKIRTEINYHFLKSQKHGNTRNCD